MIANWTLQFFCNGGNQTFSACCPNQYQSNCDIVSDFDVSGARLLYFCCFDDDDEDELGPGGGPNEFSRFPQWLQFPVTTTGKFR